MSVFAAIPGFNGAFAANFPDRRRKRAKADGVDNIVSIAGYSDQVDTAIDVVVGDSGLLGASQAEFGGVSRVVYRLFPEMS